MKRCIIIVFSLLTANLLYSQTTSLSLSTGISLSSSLNSDSEIISDKIYRPGTYLGFSGNFKLNRTLGIGTGLDYRLQNYSLESDSPYYWPSDYPEVKSVLITDFQSHSIGANFFITYHIKKIHTFRLSASYLFTVKSSTYSYFKLSPKSKNKYDYDVGIASGLNENNASFDIIYSIAPFTSQELENLSFSISFSRNFYSDSIPFLDINTLRYSFLAGVNYMFLD